MATTAITVVLAAIAYSFVVFFSKQSKDGGESFSVRKFVRTLLVGVIVGVAALQTGIELSTANFMDIATSMGAITVADQLTKVLFRHVDIDAAGRWLTRSIKNVLDYAG